MKQQEQRLLNCCLYMYSTYTHGFRLTVLCEETRGLETDKIDGLIHSREFTYFAKNLDVCTCNYSVRLWER